MTRRRWIAEEWNEHSAVLRNAQAAHLARVLRARVGQEFDIATGETVRRGVIESVREDAIEFSLHEEVAAGQPLPLTIGMSIVRFERFEWAIEKLTELGVANFVPLAAERSEKHLVQAAAKRAERWRKIARESAQQSRRHDVPEISAPLPVAQWMREPIEGPKFLLSESERVLSLQAALDAYNDTAPENLSAAIGPEGGWTSRELDAFTKYGWQSVSVGPRILRAETAAIVVATLAGAWLERDNFF